MQLPRNLSSYVTEFPVAEPTISDVDPLYDHEPLLGGEEAESSRGNEQDARAERQEGDGEANEDAVHEPLQLVMTYIHV
jgi:hypothetical protein